MSESTIDAETKRRVAEALLAHAESELEAAIGSVQDEHAAGELDQTDVVRTGDQSQAYEAGDLEGLFERSAERQRSIVGTIKALDLSPTDVVRPGAVVGFGGDHYVLGVVCDPFDVDGVTYEGIGPDAPVAEAIDGLRAGDTFTVNDQQQTIEAVG